MVCLSTVSTTRLGRCGRHRTRRVHAFCCKGWLSHCAASCSRRPRIAFHHQSPASACSRRTNGTRRSQHRLGPSGHQASARRVGLIPTGEHPWSIAQSGGCVSSTLRRSTGMTPDPPRAACDQKVRGTRHDRVDQHRNESAFRRVSSRTTPRSTGSRTRAGAPPFPAQCPPKRRCWMIRKAGTTFRWMPPQPADPVPSTFRRPPPPSEGDHADLDRAARTHMRPTAQVNGA